jgi:hypothetical protein
MSSNIKNNLNKQQVNITYIIMELTDSNNDMEYVYNQLLTSFNKMHQKEIKMNHNEMKSYLSSFCEKLDAESKYFKLFLARDYRVFKGIKFTFIPKIKFEVIMSSEQDEHKKVLEQMWGNMYLLYLIGEAEKSEPNKHNMSRVAFALDLMNGKANNDILENKTMPDLFTAFKDINMDEVEKMVSSMGISKDQLDSIKSNVGIDFNDDKIKQMMSEFVKPPTENSHIFMNNILSDIKNKFKLNEDNGKVNAKMFVDQLLNVGNSIGDEYGKKVGSGELAVGDIIGALSSLATNPNSNVITEITDTLKLDKLDMKEVIEELKVRMNGKIPNELMDLLSNFDPSNINNLDIGGLIGTMMGSGENKEIPELTDDQKKELLEYYNSMEL